MFFFFKLDFSTTKRVPILNDTSSEGSRRDVCNADVFDTGAIPTAVEIPNIDHGKSAQRDVMCMVIHGISAALSAAYLSARSSTSGSLSLTDLVAPL